MQIFNLITRRIETKKLQKIKLIMKLSLILVFTGTICLWANTGHAQNARVNLHLEGASLTDVFREIEKQSDYRFFYNNTVVNTGEKIDLNAANESVADLLKGMFQGTDIHYRMVNNYIVITTQGDGMDELLAKATVLQGIQISGTVTDETGDPLPGVNVVVKGTTTGVITGANGTYNITAPNADAVLAFSFVGYASQEIVVGAQRVINVTLGEGAQQIEEVVVIGYGTIKKEAVTGAVARANLDVYKDVPSNNILDKIKGSVAGLNIAGTNRAGNVGDMIIRGQNSIGASNYPLIVVDGAIFAGSLADISPNDIESLTVLKDASAAAVYGSRSANGVIIIETKRGTGLNGKPVFSLELNYGICNQLKPLKVYEGDAFLQRVLDCREANGVEAIPDKIEFYLYEEERKNYLATPDHRPTLPNPYDVLLQSAYNRNLSFSVANRMEKTRYYIASSLIDQKGVEIADQYKSLSARVNIDSDITDWLNIGIKSLYGHRDRSGSWEHHWSKTFWSPYATLKDENGEYLYYPQTTTQFTSPFWRLPTENVILLNNLNAIVSATVKVPWIKGLSFSSILSNTLRWENRNEFFDKRTYDGREVKGIGSRQAINQNNLLWDNMMKYNRTFLEKHFVDLTLLFSQEKYSREMVKASAQGFDNDKLGTYRLQDGAIQSVSTEGSASEAIGLMARGTYTYNNKYSVTGTIRRDGFSAFSKNKKYGTFPSVGVNWNISRENFMENISFLNNLAVRATYGSNGNQSIGLYQTLARVSSDYYVYGGESAYTLTQRISSLATDNLGWETTTGLNLGIDFGWLNGRINGSVDMYRTKTNDMIFSLSLPSMAGIGSILSNVGEIQNRGIEISLNTLNISRGDFKWYSYFVFALNRNEVVSIFGDKDANGKEPDLISAGYFMGKPLGVIYDYKVLGMYQQADADNGKIMKGWRPGEYILEDLDNSGTITSDKDRQILGNRKENFRWSFTNTFQYRGFSLMTYLYSIWGGNNWYLSGDNAPQFDSYIGTGNLNHPVYDYWTPRNTGAFFPRPDNGRTGAVLGRKFIDRSFIKLQKISLTYDVGKWVKPWKINDLIVGVSADNIYTLAPHWIGLDPEMNQGITATSMPSIRTYNFSISVKF